MDERITFKIVTKSPLILKLLQNLSTSKLNKLLNGGALPRNNSISVKSVNLPGPSLKQSRPFQQANFCWWIYCHSLPWQKIILRKPGSLYVVLRNQVLYVCWLLFVLLYILFFSNIFYQSLALVAKQVDYLFIYLFICIELYLNWQLRPKNLRQHISNKR